MNTLFSLVFTAEESASSFEIEAKERTLLYIALSESDEEILETSTEVKCEL